MLMGAAQQFFCGPDETSLQEPSNGASDRSAVFDECVYREDSTVVLELTTRSMMEVLHTLTCFLFHDPCRNGYAIHCLAFMREADR